MHMPLPISPTVKHQSSLAAYCRTGHYQPIPGVRAQHVTQYRRLVYAIIDDILQAAFPITVDLLGTDEWETLVEAFLSDHPCQSPQVWKMPGEFYDFLSQRDDPLDGKYPFLLELIYFEWLEVDLFMMEDIPPATVVTGDVTKEALVINPEHLLKHFHYPIHLKKAPEITHEDFGDYYLVLFRQPDTGQIQYMDLSPALVYLIELLSNGPLTPAMLTQQICAAFNLTQTEAIRQTLMEFLHRGLENKLILGYSTSTS
jgi:uncharacterized protein